MPVINLAGLHGVLYSDQSVMDEEGNAIRPGIVFHCFSHTRISKWVEEGWSDSHIRLASGHKDIEAYRIYVKMDAASVMRLVGGPRVERHTNDIKTAQMPITSAN